MKNIIFLLAIVFLASCKKHHDDEIILPVSKSDSLHVVFIGDYSTSIKSHLYLNGGNGTVWDKYTPSYTHIEYHLDTIFQGGQKIKFGAQTSYSDGSLFYYGTYKIKITYGNTVMADSSFTNNYSGTYAIATLPFIK